MIDSRCRVLTALVVLAVLAAVAPDRYAAAAITVENVASGETLRYPVALLRGRAPGEAQLQVVNRDNNRPDGANQAAVVRDRFATLVELVPGRNRLKISTDRESADLVLTYRPMTTPYQVNVVYVTASDGDPRYITQRDDDRQNFADKLDTAAKLMQTFTAEALAEQGFGRKTFKLDLDPAGRVRVHLLKHPLSRAELQAEGFDLYGTLAGWLDGRFPMQFNKNMVLMAFTEKNSAGELKAHTALGGGGMGLFGSGSLFSWPNSLEDVAAVFADTTPIDASRVHDDSVDRSVIWGLASTTIGATLHEMGHTFDLPHSPDPFCIMSRGFDHFNRRFSVIEPPSKHSPEPYAFRDDEVARYWPFFAAQLAHHRWFQPDAADYDNERGPTIRLDWAKKEFVFEAPHGIALVGAAGPEIDQAFYRVFDDRRTKTLRVPQQTLWTKCGGPGNLELVLFDHETNRVGRRDADFRNPDEFIHTWRVSREPYPWANPPASPPLSTADRSRLIAALRKSKPVRYRNQDDNMHWSMDFNQIYGFRDRAVAYALATVPSTAPAPMRLLAGADDGLRVWLNDELVLDKPGMQCVSADGFTADVNLKAGDNTLLVEVTQGGGGWGFSLRLDSPVADGQ